MELLETIRRRAARTAADLESAALAAVTWVVADGTACVFAWRDPDAAAARARIAADLRLLLLAAYLHAGPRAWVATCGAALRRAGGGRCL